MHIEVLYMCHTNFTEVLVAPCSANEEIHLLTSQLSPQRIVNEVNVIIYV